MSGKLLAGGRYRLQRLLGSGGMADVYLADDRNLDTQVVIKVPQPALLADPQFAERFRREIRSLVQLSHPHIVKLFDVGEHEGVPFAVMQYLAGGSAEDRPRALHTLRAWLPQIGSALDFIHSKGFVHRDVKPGNILFDENGNAYLSDFGIVKAVAEGERSGQRDATLTRTGMVVGTPDYMAPEVIMGEPYDGRADQYSLAVVLYELLAGQRPFDGPTPAAVLVQHTTVPVPELVKIKPQVPAALSDAVVRALAKRPEDRFGDCRAFGSAVLETADQRPGSAVSPPSSSAPAQAQGSRPTAPEAGKTPVIQADRPQVADRFPRKRSDRVAQGGPAASDFASRIPAASDREVASSDRPPHRILVALRHPADPLREVPSSDRPPRRPWRVTVREAILSADQGLGRLAGEGNSLLHHFLRFVCLGIPLAIVVWIAVQLGTSPRPAVIAEGSPVETFGAGTAKIDGEATATGEPTVSRPELGKDGGAVVSVPGEADPVVEIQPAPPPLHIPSAKPADEPGAVGESGKEPAAADPGVKSDISPAKTEAAKTEGKWEPAGKEAASKEPAGKEPLESKPDRKPAEKKPPAPPKKKPFADLKAVVTLPDPSAAGGDPPSILGLVHVPQDELCFIKLRGGEKAAKGTQQFVMKNARGGLADKEWEIFVRDGDGSQTMVASMVIDENSNLVFHWGPNAKTQPLSPYLRNCALSLSCAGESKVIVLRESTMSKALTIDLEESEFSQDWMIEFCPDPAAVRFELIGIQGAAYEADRPGLFQAEKGEARIRVKDGGGLLSLKLEATLRRQFRLTVSSYVGASNDPSPSPFRRRMLPPAIARVEQASRVAASRVREMARQGMDQMLAEAELQAEKWEEQVEALKGLEDFIESLRGGMKLQFRLYYDADGSQVELLRADR